MWLNPLRFTEAKSGICDEKSGTRPQKAGHMVTLHKVIYAKTALVMLMAKNDEPFSIWDGFLEIGSDMSTDSKLAKKYGPGKTKTTQIIKDKGNHFSVLKNQTRIVRV